MLYAILHAIAMESSPSRLRLPNLGAELQPLRKVGWLERLCLWFADEQGGDAVSRDKNSKPLVVSSALDSVAEEAVKEAIQAEKSNEQYEPGSRIGRLLPARIASPARSEPGNFWDMRLAAPDDSEEYKQAIAGIEQPTTLSKTERKAIELVNSLAPNKDVF